MYIRCVFLTLLVLNLNIVTSSDLSRTARLCVTKEILNVHLVESKEVTVLYKIYNFSPSRPARDVEIHDKFPESDFTVIQGGRSTRWVSIAPSSNVTHAVIIIPNFVGNYNFSSAEVMYKAGQDSKITFGYSSAPGLRTVVTPSHFNRQFSSHWLEWIFFAFITAPCLVIPYMMWHSAASKYIA